MLTQTQRIAVRRHMGLPFAGTAQAGRLFGWRFEMHVEDLEYRMSNMQPPEEALLTGNAVGGIYIGGVPQVGNRVDVGLTDGTNTIAAHYITQPNDVANPQDGSIPYSVALGLGNAFTTAAGLIVPGRYAGIGVPPGDLIAAPPLLPPTFAEMLVQEQGNTPFVLTASATGAITAMVEQQGAQSPVIANFNDPVRGALTLNGYIAVLDYLVMQMTRADVSLWIEKAGKVNFRKDEVRARRGLYMEYVLQFEQVVGGSAYVQKFGGGRRAGAGATA